MSDNWTRERAESVLLSEAAKLKMPLSYEQGQRLLAFGELVFEGNKRINLTGKLDWPILIYKHLLDSLSVLPYTQAVTGKVLDVGTGAGFPGVPLAIIKPQWQVTLLDSLRKRTDFLTETTEKLSLPVEIVWSRAEDYGQSTGREIFSLVVSRAVAKLPVLLELCLPSVAVGGQFIAYKGPEEELGATARALELLGGEISAVHQLQLPQGYGQRQLIIVEKIRPTPASYPRRAGIPEKKPLLP